MLQFLGRFHPLLVHFPIALLLCGVLLSLWKRKEPASSGVRAFLDLGALGAVLAALTGWIYAAQDPPGHSVADTLFWHRWAGVATAVLAVAAAWSARKATARTATALFVLAALGVSAAGHLGGELVYGEGYLTAPLRAKQAPATTVTPEPVSEPGPVATAPEPEPARDPEPDPGPLAAVVDPVDEPEPAGPPPIDFARDVHPILETHCFECHGPTGRAKAGLRLAAEAALFADEPLFWVVIPGEPAKSILYELVSAPESSEDRMPPEGPMLTPEELDVVRRWIEEVAAPGPGGG